MAFKGDTVRLEVEFYDIHNRKIEPEEVYLNVYDRNDIAIQSILLEDKHKTGVGQYYYDYTIPYTVSDFVTYEFSASYKDKPVLAREKIHVEFV